MESMVIDTPNTTVISNPIVSSNRIISRRKRNKKLSRNHSHNNNTNNNNNNNDDDDHVQSNTTTATITTTEWKTQAQQQVYTSKLIKALRQVRISSPEPAAPKGGRAIREVADRVLAVTAKGRSRWSRAILTNRLKLKFLKKHSKKQKFADSCTSRLPKKPRVGILKLKTKSLPAFQKKARVLGRLVPGCKKQPVPVILEEAGDYIAALQMQIRAMSALADLLSVGGSSTTTTTTATLDQLGSSREPPPT